MCEVNQTTKLASIVDRLPQPTGEKELSGLDSKDARLSATSSARGIMTVRPCFGFFSREIQARPHGGSGAIAAAAFESVKLLSRPNRIPDIYEHCRGWVATTAIDRSWWRVADADRALSCTGKESSTMYGTLALFASRATENQCDRFVAKTNGISAR